MGRPDLLIGRSSRSGDEFVQQVKLLFHQLGRERFTPVRLVPGRFRLATRPSATRSAAITNTIGIVAVAAFTAGAD
jgi:hypothetical protein